MCADLTNTDSMHEERVVVSSSKWTFLSCHPALWHGKREIYCNKMCTKFQHGRRDREKAILKKWGALVMNQNTGPEAVQGDGVQPGGAAGARHPRAPPAQDQVARRTGQTGLLLRNGYDV